MRGKLYYFGLAMLFSVLIIAPLQAADTWEILAQSSGCIESATINAKGEVSVLEQLHFTRLDHAGAIAFSRNLPLEERIFVSPRGNVYAVIRYRGVKEMVNAANMTMFDRSGRPLWSVTDHRMNDIFPLETGGAVALSRNINVLANRAYFFSNSGQLLKEVLIPAPGGVISSSSGKRILINSGVEGALLFDESGRLLSRLGAAYRMAFSQDGRWVATLYGPQISLFYDGKPTFQGELGGEIVRGAAFSPDNALVATFTDHAFFLLKNPGGQVILQRQLDPEGELSYTSVDLLTDGSYIALGVERDLGESVKGPQRHPEGKVIIYDRSGLLCYQKNITYSHWNTTTPRVKFSPDGKYLLVLTRDEVMRAPVVDLCRKGGK